MQEMKKERLLNAAVLCAGLAFVLLCVLWVAAKNGADLLAHSPLDSYTLQAMAWRDGRIALTENIEYLELAIYQGQYYVSFPPVPAIPMWLLSFFFGENTPSGLMTVLYLLGSYAVLFYLCRRYFLRWQSALMAVFVVLGGSLLDIAISGDVYSGGVWYQAQMLGLLFTALAFFLVDGKSPKGWAAGLICIALAVGCRPFNAIYVPVLLYLLYRNIRQDTLLKTLRKALPYLIVPALIACAYGGYNIARFGSPFEFGHSYLPELEQAGEGMFVPSRIWDNIKNIMRPPYLEEGALLFPILSGFAVYLTNPMLIIAPARTAVRAIRRKADPVDLLLGLSLLVHALLLLSHRTNGGWQYGTRYLCDLLPALCFLAVRGRQALRTGEAFAMGALTLFNVYATIAFHVISQTY